MNSLNKLLGLLMAAVMLAAFAVPAGAAPKKSISLSVTPAVLQAGPNTVQATITNTGNSNANSFAISFTAFGDVTVVSASIGGTPPSVSVPGQYTFLYQVPTKQSVTVTLSVIVNNACAAASLDWLANAWTGAPGDVSTSFDLTPPGPRTTTYPGNCTIGFVTQPKDAFIGSTITGSALDSSGDLVSVQALQNGVAQNGVSVLVSASPACVIAEATVSTASGIAEFALTSAASATQTDCQLTASATGYGSAASNSFDVVLPGELGCNAGVDNEFGVTGGGLVLDGTRLQNVVDPEVDPDPEHAVPPECVVVPYVLSTTCPPGVTGIACSDMIYDPLGQGTHMAFHFRWEWPIEAIPEGGIDAIPETLQLFINGNPVPVDLDLCPNTIAVYDEDGEFVELIADPAYTGPFPHPQDQDTTAPGTQAGCLISRSVIQDGSVLKILEEGWATGDYTAIRR